MTFFDQIIWDLDDDPRGNVQHIARQTIVSKSSGEQITFGYTAAGRYLAVAWQLVSDDPLIARPITAFDPNRRS